LLKRDSIL